MYGVTEYKEIKENSLQDYHIIINKKAKCVVAIAGNESNWGYFTCVVHSITDNGFWAGVRNFESVSRRVCVHWLAYI